MTMSLLGQCPTYTSIRVINGNILAGWAGTTKVDYQDQFVGWALAQQASLAGLDNRAIGR